MSLTGKVKGPTIDSGVCRCCGRLKKCRLLNVEYSWQGRKEVYSEMFIDSFGLVLSHLDGEAEERLVCATCVTRLRDASLFRQQVLQCEQRLLTQQIQLHEGETNNIIIKEEDSFIKNEENMFMDEQVDDDAVSDTDCNDTALSTVYDDPKIVEQRKTRALSLKVKSITNNENKSNANGIDPKQEKFKDKSKSPVRIHEIIKNFYKSNAAVSKDGSFLNAVTIVENSYACPFNAFYNIYHCVYCRQTFIDPDRLREHTLTHDPNAYRDILKNIRRNNNKCNIDVRNVNCRLCDEKMDDVNAFQTHVSSVHGKRVYAKTSVVDDFIILKFNLTNTNLKCSECEKVFGNFHSLKLHMAEHFGTSVCDVCGVHYFEEKNLKAHLKSHKPKEDVYTCTECGKTFKCKYNLTVHTARLHTKEAVYLCTKCDETFFSDSLRRKHMVDAHNEESIYKCKSCDKVYNNRKQMLEHNRRTHLKIYKHQCRVCEKRFFQPGNLKEHMYCHTGERNFRCEHCGKSYPRLKSLKVHMQSHTDDKKYKCNLCTASYSQNVCLKNHVKRQHQTVDMD